MADAGTASSAEKRIVGVQFRRAAAMIYDFDAGSLELAHDTRVIVEGDKGEAIGWTVGAPEARDAAPDAAVKKVLRVATAADGVLRSKHQDREREAVKFCAKHARELGLTMKVVAAEWSHSGDKASFFFSSEERVDFRTLVKDLAQRFRVRVEMRQVGRRDEVKIIGSVGMCGRATCCSTWLRGYQKLSIRYARDQGLPVRPERIQGVCGELLCCLAYEQDTYKELRKGFPKIGKTVSTPDGNGRVVDALVLQKVVRVAYEGQFAWKTWPVDQVKPVGPADLSKDDDDEGEAPAATKQPGKSTEPKLGAPTPGGPAKHLERPGNEQRRDQQRRDQPRRGEGRRGEKPATAAPTAPVEAKPADATPVAETPAPAVDPNQRRGGQRPERQRGRDQQRGQQQRPPDQNRRAQPTPGPTAPAAPADPGSAAPATPATAPGQRTPQQQARDAQRQRDLAKRQQPRPPGPPQSSTQPPAEGASPTQDPAGNKPDQSRRRRRPLRGKPGGNDGGGTPSGGNDGSTP